MLVQQHPSSLLSDYVLDLLSLAERRQVEQHLAICSHCRAAVREERQLAREVRNTLTKAAEPAHAGLRKLMPEPPQRRQVALAQLFWRPVAAMALALVLFIGLTQWNQPGAGGPFVQPSATTMASTVTHTPTATVTSISAGPTTSSETVTAWPSRQPVRTPLAAVPPLLASR